MGKHTCFNIYSISRFALQLLGSKSSHDQQIPGCLAADPNANAFFQIEQFHA